jgi:hypothetical protein
MALTGTTKKVTLNQLLATSPTATLASATITGDLTVDTSTLKVDSANNRVGVLTASPSTSFHTQSDGVASGAGWTAIGRFNNTAQTKGVDIGYNPSNNNAVITALSGGTASGFEFWSFDSGWATRMTLNSTGLGVGGSPLAKLTVVDTSGNFSGSFRGAGGTNLVAIGTTSLGASINGYTAGFGAAADLILQPNGGNVGVGVTPSAWAAAVKAFQIGAIGSVAYDGTNYDIASNRYIASGGTSTYIANGFASMARQVSGTHLWFTAPSGTAGNAITFTQAMTLTAAGDLLVGTTVSPSTVGASGFYTQNLNGTGGRIFLGKTVSGSLDALANYHNGTYIGGVVYSNTATSFPTSSDYRLKEQVQPLVDGLSRVNALKPSIYKWKSDGSNSEGFLAHELAEVVPLAVTGEKDAVNEDGSIKPQAVDLSKVVPILVAAIKELTARVEALEA